MLPTFIITFIQSPFLWTDKLKKINTYILYIHERPSQNCNYLQCTKGLEHNTVEWQCTKSLDSTYSKSLALIRPIWERWARWEHIRQNHTPWMHDRDRTMLSCWHTCLKKRNFKGESHHSARKERVIQSRAPRSSLQFKIYALMRTYTPEYGGNLCPFVVYFTLY